MLSGMRRSRRDEGRIRPLVAGHRERMEKSYAKISLS